MISRLASICEIRVEGKAQQAAFVKIIDIKTAEDSERLNDMIRYVEKRLGLELPLMNDEDQASLIHDIEPTGYLWIGEQIDRGGQA